MLPMVKDKRRDVSVTCFAMIDHTEKRIQCNYIGKNIELSSLLQNLIEQHGCQMWPSILLFALLEQKKARYLSWIGGLIPKQNEEQVVDTLSHFKFLCLTKGFLFWVACTASLCVAFHDAPVVDILPSPHIANTVLSIGGRIWALWKSVDLVCSNSIKKKLHFTY